VCGRPGRCVVPCQGRQSVPGYCLQARHQHQFRRYCRPQFSGCSIWAFLPAIGCGCVGPQRRLAAPPTRQSFGGAGPAQAMALTLLACLLVGSPLTSAPYVIGRRLGRHPPLADFARKTMRAHRWAGLECAGRWRRWRCLLGWPWGWASAALSALWFSRVFRLGGDLDRID